jgi:hypothetical protein
MPQPTFITLGPRGSCHENALRHYLEFQEICADVELVDDLLKAIDLVRGRPRTYLLQCSAHLNVHLVTERHVNEVFVIDTFLFPTKELALLVRKGVANPQSLGIVPAAHGYVDLSEWESYTDETTKPVVGRKMLEGKYDAGLTHLHYAEEYPNYLEARKVFGEIDTTWLVYGTRRRFDGKVVAIKAPWLYS